MKTNVAVACGWMALQVIVPRMLPAEETPDYKSLYEEQKKRNDTLERRVGILEEKDKAEPYVEKSGLPENTLKFLQQTEITGYVSASYFHNFNNPGVTMNSGGDTFPHVNTGRGFDVHDDEFMANKVVVKLQKAVEYDAFEWRAGYCAEVIFGQDAAFTQASGLSLGDNGDLLQAYVEINIPIGNGLKVVIGKYNTPLGYELTETELNSNWSPGNQWTFLVPFTHTGIHFSYQLTSQVEVQFMVNNGWDVVTDNNTGKSFIGRVAWTPNEKSSVTVIGYSGPEQTDPNHDPVDGMPGANGHQRRGVDVVLTHKCTPKLSTAVQLDYGMEEGVDANGGDSDWCGVGVWVVFAATEKVELAFRGDWVKDGDGWRTSDTPALAPFPVNNSQELTSFTLTLNFRPVENVRLSPEIRVDRSTLDTAFDGHDTQVTIGMGAAFFY